MARCPHRAIFTRKSVSRSVVLSYRQRDKWNVPYRAAKAKTLLDVIAGLARNLIPGQARDDDEQSFTITAITTRFEPAFFDLADGPVLEVADSRRAHNCAPFGC